VVTTSARVLRCCFGVHPSEAEAVAEQIRATQERATSSAVEQWVEADGRARAN
jgi:hypothetical protein